MTDQQLAEAAIKAVGASAGHFARVIGVDPRRMRRLLDGTEEHIHPSAVIICRGIIARPALFQELAELSAGHDGPEG